jgi:ubiquinone/menaquinone biosynthesis C-methylase UbiE
MRLARSERFDMPALRPPPLNAHHEGRYDEREMEWRRLNAIDKAENIARLLGPRRDELDSVLEAGCGTGVVLAMLRGHLPAAEFVGVDMADPDLHTDPMVAETGIRLVRSDGTRLPFEDGSFDLVYASHVLEHVEDERGFLRELARVARKYVVVEVPCELTLQTTIGTIQHNLTTLGHINSFTPHAFALTLATSGLEVAELRLFDHSEAVQAFHASPLKGKLKRAIRTGMLKLHPGLAAKIFVYHCGALCDVRTAPGG